MNDKIRFTVTYSLETTLCLDNIWPDGDAPDDPRVEDVYRAMFGWQASAPSPAQVLKMLYDWNLGAGSVFRVVKAET